MCGSPGKLYKAVIEDAELTVCHECSKFGKVIGVVKQEDTREIKAKAAENISQPEKIDVIIGDYAEKIRKKREQLGLKQEEFAKKINEKESLVQKIESGHFEPPIILAKKIEGFLKIKLVEEHEEAYEHHTASKTGTFTLGDFIKKK